MIPLRRVCSRFITYVGIDDSGGGRGSAEALIYADGDLIYNSTEDLGMILTNGVGPVKVEIDVRDVGRIRLIGDLPWVFRYAKEEHLKHSNLNWAEPIVHCGPTSSKLPRVEITPLGANPEVADIGSSVSFSGSAFSARGAALANIWTVNLWHCQGSLCHIHPDIAHGIGGNFTFTLVEHPNCIFFEVKLSAGDVCGRVGTDSFFVRSRTNDAECRL